MSQDEYMKLVEFLFDLFKGLIRRGNDNIIMVRNKY